MSTHGVAEGVVYTDLPQWVRASNVYIPYSAGVLSRGSNPQPGFLELLWKWDYSLKALGFPQFTVGGVLKTRIVSLLHPRGSYPLGGFTRELFSRPSEA